MQNPIGDAVAVRKSLSKPYPHDSWQSQKKEKGLNIFDKDGQKPSEKKPNFANW